MDKNNNQWTGLSKLTRLAFAATAMSGLMLIWAGVTPVSAQKLDALQTTGTVTVHVGPGSGFDSISVLDPNVQVTIIPPKSVIIGKGVTMGSGVLIEGKPWVNVRLPDGRSGYVKGSALCTRTEGASVRVALCSP